MTVNAFLQCGKFQFRKALKWYQLIIVKVLIPTKKLLLSLNEGPINLAEYVLMTTFLCNLEFSLWNCNAYRGEGTGSTVYSQLACI